MPTNLTSYPAYKNSGVPWLGEVPEHWEVSPALAVYKPKLIRNTGMIEKTVLSLSYGRIVVKPPEKLRGLVPDSFETYQIVDPGNIIVRTTDLQNDHTSLRIGHSRNRGIITAAYMCLETTSRVSNEFGYQFLNAYDLIKIIYGFGTGLRQNLDFDDIKRMPVLVPTKAEQAAIVRFLDHADRKIRRYIRAKQKLIKLLEEQKQVIIHHAVTRGLDPNVRLKPSGVEWLGEIPEHWEVRKLGSVGRVFNGTTPSRNQSRYWNGGTIPWLSSGKVNDGVVESPSELVTEAAFRETSVSIVPRGSVIIGLVGQGKTRGMCARLNIDACINQNLAAVVPGKRVSGNYLRYLLAAFYNVIREAGRGGNQEALNCEIVSSFRFSFPPLPEQEEITTHLETQVATMNEAQQKARREITLLGELRTRLIADVVTGKLDVREATASLPEEADEEELACDVEGIAEEEAFEDAELEAEPVAV